VCVCACVCVWYVCVCLCVCVCVFVCVGGGHQPGRREMEVMGITAPHPGTVGTGARDNLLLPVGP